MNPSRVWEGRVGGRGWLEEGREAAVVVVVVVVGAVDATPRDDSLYHSVVGADGFLVTDAHGVLASTRPVLLLPQRFPANGNGCFQGVRMTSCHPPTDSLYR